MNNDNSIERAMDAKKSTTIDNRPDTNVGDGYHPPPGYQVPPSFQQMLLEDNSGINIGQIFKSVWYHRGLFATLTLILATILVLGNYFVFPDRYEAIASVRVKAFSIDDAEEATKAFEILPGEVLSNRVLEKVITDLDLTKRDSIPVIENVLTSIGITPNENGTNPSVILRWLKKDVEILQETVGETKTALFKVKLVDSDPEKVTSIVNAIVDTYIQTRNELDSQDSKEAAVFLAEKIKVAEAAMQTAAGKLTDFQVANANFLIPTTTLERNLEELREEYTTGSVRIAQIQELRIRVKESLKQEERYVISSAYTGRASSIDGQLHALKVKLASAEAEYTRTHPTVIYLRSKIKELRQTVRNTPRTGISGMSKTSNPQWISLKRGLDEIDTEQVVLEKRLPQIKDKIAELNEKIARTLATQRNLKTVEAEWEKLYGDYRAMNDEYIEYKTRAEADASTVGHDLQVLDYANVPSLSAAAPRTTLMIFGVILAIVIALIVTLITSRSNNWEIPSVKDDNIKTVSLAKTILTSTLGLMWLTMLIIYIIITPYL